MKWLYMLFTLIMDGPVVPLESNIKLPFVRPVSGMDERFPPLEDDTVITKICLHHYYLEQLRYLESSFHQTTLEDVIKNPIVREVLSMHEISPGRMNAGGLLDDWERNI